MKRFLEFTVKFKTYACMMFTGIMFLYMVIGWATGCADSISFAVMLQFLLISVLGCALQTLAFTDIVLRHMRYSRRVLLFVALFLPLLSACAFGLHWFPVENAASWLIFLGIFLCVFVVMTAGFEIYFRIQGQKYDGLLGQYRREREQNK